MNHMIKAVVLALVAASLPACSEIGGRLGPQPASLAPVHASAQAPTGSLSGEWSGSLTDPQGGKHPIRLNLKVNGESVTGTLTGGPPDGAAQSLMSAKLQGDQLSFEIKMQGPQGEGGVLYFKGRVSGNRVQGMHGLPGESFPWEATQQ